MLAFVIHRDRLTYADRCIAALEEAGLETVIVDHDSAFEPAMVWLQDMADFGFRVWRESTNRHPRDLWRPAGPIDTLVPAGERFIVTDCDVVPDPDCPGNWPTLLGALLDEHPNAVKAGLGLRTDDLPEHFGRRAEVQAWEAQFQPQPGQVVVGNAAWADVDTTLAMYRRYERFALGPAIRTVGPYWARHLPWYEDTANLTPELAFYAAHAEHGHWRNPEGFTDTHAIGGVPPLEGS